MISVPVFSNCIFQLHKRNQPDCTYRPVASQPGGGGGLNLDGWNTRRTPPLGHCPRDVINLKNAPTLGHSQAPPLGHCPCDVINLKNAPTLGHSQAPPPLGHCPCDVINLKNAPTLGHSQAPPLGHCPCDVINLKNAPTLGHSQAPTPPLGHCPCDVINLKNAPTLGHSQAPPLGHCPCDVIHIFQGWNKIAKGWNKIAEGWNKIAKGWNKIAERWNKIAKGWNKIFGMGNWGGVVRPPRPPPLATGLTYVTLGMVMDVWKGVMSEPVSWYSLMAVKHVLSVIINSDASLMEEQSLVQSPSLS